MVGWCAVRHRVQYRAGRANHNKHNGFHDAARAINYCGDMADDDEQRNAYNRAIFYQFADIVQHYDDECRPDHDDIDYQPATLDQLDGGDYDQYGDPVPTLGVILHIHHHIIAVADAIDEFGNAVTDDPAEDNDEPGFAHLFAIDCGFLPTKHRLDECYGHDDQPDDPDSGSPDAA